MIHPTVEVSHYFTLNETAPRSAGGFSMKENLTISLQSIDVGDKQRLVSCSSIRREK